MYCSKCGAENPEEARYCRNCSNPFIKDEVKKKQNKTWIYLIITLILLSLVALLIFNNSNNKRKQESDNKLRVENELRIKNLQDSIELVQKEVSKQNAIHDSLQLVQKPKMNSEPQKHEKLNAPEKKTQNTGYFTDERDGKKYKWVKIGDQVWMAENLAFKPKKGNYWAYNNDQNNVDLYGYLYSWKTANEIAPIGWHLPDDEEWSILNGIFNDDEYETFLAVKDNGTSGLNLLQGGCYYDGKFRDIGKKGWFWSSTGSEYDVTANAFLINPSENYASYGSIKDLDYGFSVRLIKN